MGYLGTRKNGAGLSRSRRSVEQKMGQFVVLDEGPDGVDDVFVGDQLVQRVGSILLDPGKIWRRFLRFSHRVNICNTIHHKLANKMETSCYYLYF